jgi:hypothetical protein
VLVPSYRPAGLQQVVIGDRLHDPNWVAINVNKDTYLPASIEKIAGLTRITVEGAKLSPTFTPEVKDYAVTVPIKSASVEISAEPTSRRSSALTMNGETVQPATPHRIKLSGNSVMKIRVTSPDGTQTADYSVTVLRK